MPSPRSLTRRVAAFTLLEIMLVVAIIMLLLGAGAYFIGDYIELARRAKARADVSTYNTALRTYQMTNGFPPSTTQGLEALVKRPAGDPKPRNWVQLATEIRKDPWGNDYLYLAAGKRNPDGFDLYSRGRDGKDGTEDDLGNWPEK